MSIRKSLRSYIQWIEVVLDVLIQKNGCFWLPKLTIHTLCLVLFMNIAPHDLYLRFKFIQYFLIRAGRANINGHIDSATKIAHRIKVSTLKQNMSKAVKLNHIFGRNFLKQLLLMLEVEWIYLNPTT